MLLSQEIPPTIALVKPTRVRYQVLACACSVAVIIYIHRVGFGRALPAITDSLQLDDRHKGWLAAAFLVAYAGFEMPWGWAGDRWGVRHLLTLLVIGWSLTTGFVALAGSFAGLLILRFLCGMFQAGAFPSLSRMMTDWMPMQQRGTAQGGIWMSTRLGGMLSAPLLGSLILWFDGWEEPLWIVSGMGVLWAVIFWPWFRNRPEEMAAVNAEERDRIAQGRSAAPVHHGLPWKKLLASRSAWALCLMYGCGGFAANFFVVLLPSYLQKQCQLSTNTVDVVASLPFVGGALACIFGGIFSDWIIRRTGNRKWGRRLTGTIGTLIGALAWFVLAWLDGNGHVKGWVMPIILILIFTCNDLSMGPAWAACADIGERHAGTLGGAMNMVGNMLGAVGAVLTGYLFKAEQSAWLFAIFGMSFLLATLCWQAVDVTKPLEPKAIES